MGCGTLPLPDWTNVDQHSEQADIRGDVRELHFEGVDEVRMDHMLEHLPGRDIPPFLKRVHGWMRPGGRITVEVPDMQKICEIGLTHSMAMQWIYGAQDHDGEYHKFGFNAWSLGLALEDAGFKDVETRVFRSDHWAREGMPCAEATGVA